MKRHHKLEEARTEAKRAIEKRIEEVRAEMKEKMVKGEWAAVSKLGTELVLLGEKC